MRAAERAEDSGQAGVKIPTVVNVVESRHVDLTLSNAPQIAVWLGPARSGKTAACLECHRTSPAGSWLIVPTAQHVAALKKRAKWLSNRGNEGSVGTFGDLIRDLAGPSGDRVLRSAARWRVLEDICSRRLTPESRFARMDGVPGFARSLCELIAELKLSDVGPRGMTDARSKAMAAGAASSFSKKVSDIAAIYQDYEDFLAEHGYQDDEGLAIEAASRVGANSVPPPPAVILDGFVRLSSAWRRLLRAIAERGTSVTISLTHDEGRPLLFATSARTLERLRDQFVVNERRFHAGTYSGGPNELQQLERRIFLPPVVEAEPARPEAPGPAITLIDSPNAYAEAETVMRLLRRAHDSGQASWGEMLILLRAPAEYGTTLTSIAERFEMPLSTPQPTLAGEQAVGKAVIAVVRLLTNGWRREDLMAFLRSRFSSCSRMEAERLLRTSRSRSTRDGQQNWLELADQASDAMRASLRLLAEWQSRFESGPAPASGFAQVFRSLITALGIGEAAARVSDERQKATLDAMLSLCDSVSEVQDRISRRNMEFSGWAELMLAAWNGQMITPGVKPRHVLVADAYDARIRDARITAVMGLTERSFPRPVNEDPFLRDEERQALQAAGLTGLETRLERLDDERLLFYSAITSCSNRLILSFPRTGLEGDYLPSFFLDDVRAAVPSTHTVRTSTSDVAPRAEECCNDRDRLLSDLSGLAARAPAAEGLTWFEKLQAASESAHAAILATAVWPPLPRILDTEHTAAYRDRSRLNVSELETYRRCPLQHFMRYAVKPEMPPDGTGSADRGRLYHQAISGAFRARRARKDTGPPTAGELIEELKRRDDGGQADAPHYRQALIYRFLERAVAGFSRRELLFGDNFMTEPRYFELAFGIDLNSDEAASRDYDPESRAEPLVLRSADGARSVQLCGAIDRVDLIDGGTTVMLMDYKTGSAPALSQVLSGESIQMPIYMQAIEELWGLRGAVACYDSAREPGRRRLFRTELTEMKRFGFVMGADKGGETVKPLNEEEFRRALDAARDAIFLAAEKLEECDIKPRPGDHCRYCEYSDICRTSRDSIHDGEAFDIAAEGSSAY